MKKAEKPCCPKCRFVLVSGLIGGQSYWCHRFPPIGDDESGSRGLGDGFPCMNRDEWCGEFKPLAEDEPLGDL